MIVTGDNGSQLVYVPESSDLLNRWWSRNTPKGDAADVVTTVGMDTIHPSREVTIAVLLVQCAEYGAIPEGWESATETFEGEEFLTEYRPLDSAEQAVHAAGLYLASKELDAKNAKAKTISPWRLA